MNFRIIFIAIGLDILYRTWSLLFIKNLHLKVSLESYLARRQTARRFHQRIIFEVLLMEILAFLSLTHEDVFSKMVMLQLKLGAMLGLQSCYIFQRHEQWFYYLIAAEIVVGIRNIILFRRAFEFNWRLRGIHYKK